MAQQTAIEWCDSTLNLQAGCDGCELWNRAAGVRHCYAGVMTDQYGGRPGWPHSFEEPALFLHRLDSALRWSDLTGTARPKKPWLDGLPRCIFLNDMGDTFTESLPLDWLAPLLPRMAESPHIYMLLTKRGQRMRKFSETHPLPPNVWPGVSLTTQKTLPRLDDLLRVKGGGVKWVSAEPLLGPIDLLLFGTLPEAEFPGHQMTHRHIRLVICGGESGPGARPCDVAWVRSLVRQCKGAGAACFVKQLGANYADAENGVCGRSAAWPSDILPGGPTRRLKDPKGGDIAEFPEDLRVRQFPEVA